MGGGATVTRLHIVHETTFTYSRAVAASYNEVRMRPAQVPGQTVLESRVVVDPFTWTTEYRDYWGTLVTVFEALARHTTLKVVSDSRVERLSTEPSLPTTFGWEHLTDGDVLDRMTEFLAHTPATAPMDDLVQLALEAAAGKSPGEAAIAVCDAVRGEVQYVPGATGVHTRASEAWEVRMGVCQDLAQLAAGALRSVGIPARYVSGYLHPFNAEAAVGETTFGESHAWVEFWCGDWFGYDPTNSIAVGDHHVIVARGREYGDVSPLRGVFAGGGASEQQVEVRITRES